jgi:hypothetical protein
MREIRLSGSEGGGANPIVSPYPYPQNIPAYFVAGNHQEHQAEAYRTQMGLSAARSCK